MGGRALRATASTAWSRCRRRCSARRLLDTRALAAPTAPLWRSGDEIDLGHAKRVGGDLWRCLLQSHWGLLAASSLAANFYAGAALATKALFLGTLTATESSQLTEVRCGDGSRDREADGVVMGPAGASLHPPTH